MIWGINILWFFDIVFSYAKEFSILIIYGHFSIIASYTSVIKNRDSSVSIVMGYWLNHRSSIFVGGKILFSTPQRSDWLWDPPSILPIGYWKALSTGIKRLGCEADQSSPTSPLSYVFIACVIKYRGKFYFLYINYNTSVVDLYQVLVKCNVCAVYILSSYHWCRELG
jgi:hypothetical protein